MKPRSRRVMANGLSLCVQEWGDGVPVLAVHGWLDNSESFAALAAHLPGIHLVAPDMAGHGESEHRPVGASYEFWDEMRDLLAVADAMGWQRFALLGHSRGAMTSLLLAAAVPERIERVAFIDGLWPIPVTAADTVPQLAHYLKDALRKPRPAAVYASVAEAVAMRRQLTVLPDELLEPMVRRNLRVVEGGFAWRTDARLRHASPLKFTREHNHAFVQALQCPNRVLLAEKGLAQYRDMVDAIVAEPKLHMQVVAGGHHVHIEKPAEVAGLLQPFYAASTLRYC